MLGGSNFINHCVAPVCAGTGAVAQEKEIWACQGTDSNGFIFRSGSWERVIYNPQDFTLTLAPASAMADLYSYIAVIDNLAGEYINGMVCNQQENNDITACEICVSVKGRGSMGTPCRGFSHFAWLICQYPL